eukprot:12366993-Alexandrium_andersonii.AAC.1
MSLSLPRPSSSRPARTTGITSVRTIQAHQGPDCARRPRPPRPLQGQRGLGLQAAPGHLRRPRA